MEFSNLDTILDTQLNNSQKDMPLLLYAIIVERST